MLIPANQFISSLNLLWGMSESDKEIEEIVKVTKNDYNRNWVRLENFTFKKWVHFEDINLNVGLRFTNCTFENLYITKCEASGYDKNFIDDSYNIIFENCRVKKLVIQDNKFERGIKFCNECKITNLEIETLTTESSGVSFEKVSIDFLKTKEVALRNQSSITLSYSEIFDQVRFESINAYNIVLKNTKFKKDIFIWGDILTESLNISSCEFDEMARIRSIKCKLYQNDNIFKKAIYLEYYKNHTGPELIWIQSSQYNDGFYIDGGMPITNGNWSKVTKIELYCTAKLEGEINISYLNIGFISLTGLNSKAQIKFNTIFVKQIEMRDFFNENILIFNNVSKSLDHWVEMIEDKNSTLLKTPIPNNLTIHESNLGKTQFYNCRFDDFEIVSIHNSILTDISSLGTEWFSDAQLSKPPTYYENKAKLNNARPIDKLIVSRSYAATRDLYRQFRLVMEKQSDTKQALEFKSLEMKYYLKYLNYSNSKWWEKLILYVNQTNDFGLNWWKALWIGGLVLFVAFIPISLLSNIKFLPYRISFQASDLKVILDTIFIDNWGLYFQLLNPAHNLHHIFKNVNEMHWSIHIFDFFHRIVTSFFIFQVVAAFRKYLK